MHSNTKSQLVVPETTESQTAVSEDGSVLAHSSKETTTFFDAYAGKILGSYDRSCTLLNTVQLSSDGKYLLHLSNRRDVCLIRVADQTLLAEYNMYGDISGLALSSNDYFVCLSTGDRRLYVLLIADPDVPAHRERIQYVRDTIPKLEPQNIRKLLDIMQKNTSSNEIDVVSWSDAGSELDMDDGRKSRVHKTSHRSHSSMSKQEDALPNLVTLDRKDQNHASPHAKQEDTLLSEMVKDAQDQNHIPKSEVFSSNMCALQ
jgi:hypothetical protein